MPAGTKYPVEVKAIRELRTKYPTVPATKLAKRISTNDFPTDKDKELAVAVANRSYYSIYSVIRRFDKSVKVAA